MSNSERSGSVLGVLLRWDSSSSGTNGHPKSKLTRMVAKAAMLKRHLPGLLNYSKHRMTNAMSEGFNSKFQQIKSSARGFRSFQSYRVRILFFCGKLDLLPRKVSH
jgi:transposase